MQTIGKAVRRRAPVDEGEPLVPKPYAALAFSLSRYGPRTGVQTMNQVKRLQRAFYVRDTLTVAPALLGQRLVRQLDGQTISGRIVEVEAYIGQEDEACHASHGRTPRNAVMFGPGGHAYVYFVYGMHHCFNVVTESEGRAAAVLVRALEPVEGIALMRQHRDGREGVALTNGPAKLCYAMAIDRKLNGTDLVTSEELWIERDAVIDTRQVSTGPRIGVRGDEAALTVPWRFWVKGNEYVSRA